MEQKDSKTGKEFILYMADPSSTLSTEKGSLSTQGVNLKYRARSNPEVTPDVA